MREQIAIAQEFLRTFEQYAWFKLDPITKSTLQALISFPEKIIHRLERGEDLPTVLKNLEYLSKFVYAYLPEHKAHMESDSLEQLHAQGLECLNHFVRNINDLTHYQIPECKEEQQSKVLPKTWKDKLIDLYRNVFFRFSLWFIILLTLTILMVLLASQFFVLSPDTMTTIVICASAGGAAALAATLPRKPRVLGTEEDGQDGRTGAEEALGED